MMVPSVQVVKQNEDWEHAAELWGDAFYFYLLLQVAQIVVVCNMPLSLYDFVHMMVSSVQTKGRLETCCRTTGRCLLLLPITTSGTNSGI